MAYEATYVYGDQNRIDYTPSGSVSAGEVKIISDDLFGIATEALTANVLGSLATDGVFDVAKATTTGSAFTQGEQVFFDEVNNVAINAQGSPAKKFIGYALAAAADSASTVRVQLRQQANALA